MCAAPRLPRPGIHAARRKYGTHPTAARHAVPRCATLCHADPNTASFYVGLLLTIGKLALAGCALYSPYIVLPLAAGFVYAFIVVKNRFIEVATVLNGISSQVSRARAAAAGETTSKTCKQQ